MPPLLSGLSHCARCLVLLAAVGGAGSGARAAGPAPGAWSEFGVVAVVGTGGSGLVPPLATQIPLLQLYTLPQPVPIAVSAKQTPAVVPKMPDPYRAMFLKVARETRVPVALIAAVAAAESGFDPLARSPKGATGLMQLMPDTARRFNVVNLWSPEENLRGGAHYLRWLSERFANDMERVIAAYNAGEGAVERAGGTPPIAETQEYLPKVMRYLQHFDKTLPEKAVGARRV